MDNSATKNESLPNNDKNAETNRNKQEIANPTQDPWEPTGSVEVSGSIPLCSTKRKTFVSQRIQRFFLALWLLFF